MGWLEWIGVAVGVGFVGLVGLMIVVYGISALTRDREIAPIEDEE